MKNTVLIFFWLIFAAQLAFGQMSEKQYSDLIKSKLKNGGLTDKQDAFRYLNQAIKNYPHNALFRFILAKELINCNEYEKAYSYYKNIDASELPADELFELEYCKALLSTMNDLELAKLYITTAQVSKGLDITPLYTQYNNLVKNLKQPASMAVENLGSLINTDSSEFSCSISNDGRSFFINRQPSPYLQLHNASGSAISIYTAKMVAAGEWGSPDLIYPLAESDKQNKVALQVVESNQNNSSVLLLVTHEGNLSYLEKEDTIWTDLSQTGFERVINKRYAKELSANISRDGKKIVFASDQFSDMNLYISELKKDNTWSAPTSLTLLNTERDETAPHFSDDGKRLYFSAMRPEGLGGFDIYYSDLDSATQTWTAPKHVPYPVSSPGNDLYYVPTSTNISYLSSDRAGGYGGLDLYRVYMFNHLTVKGVVKDRDKNNILQGARVQVLYKDEIILDTLTNEQGFYCLKFPVAKTLKIRVLFDKKVLYQQYLNLDARLIYARTSPELTNNFFVQTNPSTAFVDFPSLSEGTSIILKNILFKTGSAELESSSFEELEKLNVFLVKNPSIRLRIIGHTDNLGDSLDNQKLSEDRALAIKQFIINKKRIPESRLETLGKGSKEPIFSNDDEEDGRALNRRIELLILGKKELE
ncbi:MAG: hypothetical protein EAZ57_01180 [Cytophagales bacterium]|nr:MAG: hypothetical protein EAZ67_02095 [Cytophagales bacterium]TAF62062.1 MAG: hypothetical protein EAZ57_01180 [Cytophagales bacterium]